MKTPKLSIRIDRTDTHPDGDVFNAVVEGTNAGFEITSSEGNTFVQLTLYSAGSRVKIERYLFDLGLMLAERYKPWKDEE